MQKLRPVLARVVAVDNGEREVGGGLSGCGGSQRGRVVWGLRGGWGSYGVGQGQLGRGRFGSGCGEKGEV